MNFGEKLKLLRKEAGLTQTQLAEKLQMSQASYAAWEKKETNGTLELLSALTEIFHVDIDYLVSDFYQRDELTEVEIDDDLRLSAGTGLSIQSSGDKVKVYTDKKLSRFDGAAQIRGNSMSPTFPNGTVATFRRTGFERNGEYYGVVVESYGEAQLFFKQVFLDSRVRRRFRFHSVNEDYDDFFLQQDKDNFWIIGPMVDHFQEIDESKIID